MSHWPGQGHGQRGPRCQRPHSNPGGHTCPEALLAYPHLARLGVPKCPYCDCWVGLRALPWGHSALLLRVPSEF